MAKPPKTEKRSLHRLMERMGAGCEVVSRKISEGMDRPLPLADRLRIRVHLLFCVLCTRTHRQWLLLRRLAAKQATAAERVPDCGLPGLSDRARERIKQSLRPPANR